MSPEEEKVLHQRLIQLGDMMGDGLHYERDGQWITREYKATLRALGLLKAPKRKHNPTKTLAVDEQMAQRVKDVACTQCAGKLGTGALRVSESAMHPVQNQVHPPENH
ncbi:hypothetical protein PO591_20700 [Escherichia coli]|uniref:hypothetical protein n=1 Tax=Escherichia coli TaxID=562 RepID=UPI00259C8B2E|nr:hypothetical protein [Escherichia coli]MDM4819904.1 hypothetical protein [Escherichia coli]MDM4847730.1 hypothetical protein [Escherichia coli]